MSPAEERVYALMRDIGMPHYGEPTAVPKKFSTEQFTTPVGWRGPLMNVPGFTGIGDTNQFAFNRNETPEWVDMTRAHEAEHTLQHRTKYGDNYAKLLGKDYLEFLNQIAAASPAIRKKYKIGTDYLMQKEGNPVTGRKLDSVGMPEVMATLGSIEEAHGVDLTKDKDIQLFKDPRFAAIYRSLVGLRNTQTDPRDIPSNSLDHKPGYSNAIMEMNKSKPFLSMDKFGPIADYLKKMFTK